MLVPIKILQMGQLKAIVAKNKIKRIQIIQMKLKEIIGKKLKNTYGLKKYRIQEVIKPGQVIFDSGS